MRPLGVAGLGGTLFLVTSAVLLSRCIVGAPEAPETAAAAGTAVQEADLAPAPGARP